MCAGNSDAQIYCLYLYANETECLLFMRVILIRIFYGSIQEELILNSFLASGVFSLVLPLQCFCIVDKDKAVSALNTSIIALKFVGRDFFSQKHCWLLKND